MAGQISNPRVPDDITLTFVICIKHSYFFAVFFENQFFLLAAENGLKTIACNEMQIVKNG